MEEHMTLVSANSSFRSADKRRFAFTLVELLVVIGIIAVLIGILLPALNKARKAAKTAACLSNVRQLAMAVMQYHTESKGYSPYYNKGTADDGQTQKFQIEWMAQVVKPEQLNKVRLCPEATEPNPLFLTGNQAGGAFYAWGPNGQALQDPVNGKPLTGSYTFNGYLLKVHSSGNSGSLKGGGQAGDLERLWGFPCRRSTEVPCLSDGCWSNAWPKENETVPTTGVYQPMAPASPGGSPTFGNNMGRILVARHGAALNVGFEDGHAATIQLADLWGLQWHRKWDTRNINFAQIKADIKKYYKG